MKRILSIIFVVVVLYYLKVPVVVTFVDQLRAALIPTWNQAMDSWIHFMERHPYIYASLPVVLVYLMLSGDDKHARV